jgi:tetratricopeptide (TPR) repeat protein
MSRIFAKLTSLLCTVVPFLFLCPASRSAEPPWLELHSPHYTVITDAGEKRGREVALRFEQMRSVFAGLLGKDRLSEARPLTILAFKNDKSYYQAAPLRQGQPIAAPGFLLTGEDQDFVVLNLFEDEPYRAVAHDFALRLLDFNYPPAQGWFDEGLAEYFSSIRIVGNQIEIGGDPELQPTIKEDLLGNQRDSHPPKSLTELLGAEVWMSLPDLFAVKHDPSPKNEGTHHTLYYAQSWIVMHYLLHQKKLPETGAYFALVLNQHVPVEDAIKQAYGISSAQLEQAIKDYFHGQPGLQQAVDASRQTARDPSNAMPSGATDRFPVPVGQDDSTITARPMSEADARAMYAGIQIRLADRRDMGLKTLNDLATTPTEADKKVEVKQSKRVGEDPDQLPANAIGNALAHRILAWDHVEHGEFQEAFNEMGDAAALNPRDMWVRYYLCIAKYRMAQAKHAEMMGLANMMLDLRAVLEWNPEMSDAYDLLAVARNAGGSPTNAMQSERAAIGLSPRDERYPLHLAEIYVSGKKWDAAGALLDRLKASNNPQIATAARDLGSQIGSQRKYGLSTSAAAGAQPKYEEQKSPFAALEEDAAKRDGGEQGAPGSTADARATKFVRGRLVAVDCSNAPAAVLTVSSDKGTLKLRASDYKSLLLIGADDFSCTWRDRQVTANYKSRGASDGDLVSLEMR